MLQRPGNVDISFPSKALENNLIQICVSPGTFVVHWLTQVCTSCFSTKKHFWISEPSRCFLCSTCFYILALIHRHTPAVLHELLLTRTVSIRTYAIALNSFQDTNIFTFFFFAFDKLKNVSTHTYVTSHQFIILSAQFTKTKYIPITFNNNHQD